jgi:hypothetical protein
MKTIIKNTLLLATALITTSFLFVRCDSGDEFESDKRVSIKIDMGGELMQCAAPPCLLIDENNPSNRYIRIDSVVQYGLGMDYLLPDSLKDSNLKIIVSGKMRESINYKGCIAFNLTNSKDSVLSFIIVKSETYVKHLNTWISFKDSLSISKGVNNMTAKNLRIFPYKNSGAGTFDVDNLVIEIIRE